jgi:hypothetical protein
MINASLALGCHPRSARITRDLGVDPGFELPELTLELALHDRRNDAVPGARSSKGLTRGASVRGLGSADPFALRSVVRLDAPVGVVGRLQRSLLLGGERSAQASASTRDRMSWSWNAALPSC